jgi:phospholipase C
MMENHSFDNYFGMLGRGDGFTLNGKGEPTNDNPLGDGERLRVFHAKRTSQAGVRISQSWRASHEQLGDGDNSGFISSRSPDAMAYFDGGDIPYYYSLARVFPIGDRYFCSVLAQTYPNRRFLLAATARGNITTELPKPDEPAPPGGTIFDKLSAFKKSWRNYAAIAPELILYPSNTRYVDHVATIDQFLADAAADRLPSYSVVSPNPSVSEEDPQDIIEGEAFSATIIDAVLDGPSWAKTILILTYDEHGGYYDHVPPPPAFAPDDVPPDPTRTGGVAGGYDRYGFRVPLIVMSPYAKPDYVSHVVHDHTSILRLVETKWNLGALTLRDANASNLLDMIDLWSKPAFRVPPARATPKLLEAAEDEAE